MARAPGLSYATIGRIWRAFGVAAAPDRNRQAVAEAADSGPRAHRAAAADATGPSRATHLRLSPPRHDLVVRRARRQDRHGHRRVAPPPSVAHHFRWPPVVSCRLGGSWDTQWAILEIRIQAFRMTTRRGLLGFCLDSARALAVASEPPGSSSLRPGVLGTYTAQAVHFARIAQEEGVRLYSLGTEVDRLFRTRKVGRQWTTDFRQELLTMVAGVRSALMLAQHMILERRDVAPRFVGASGAWEARNERTGRKILSLQLPAVPDCQWHRQPGARCAPGHA